MPVSRMTRWRYRYVCSHPVVVGPCTGAKMLLSVLETLSLREGSRFLRGTQGYSLSRPGVKDGIS